jgi:hypothetical protein
VFPEPSFLSHKVPSKWTSPPGSPLGPLQREMPMSRDFLYIGRFTTCGHYCRRWFPRSLWSKKFI